MRTLLLVVPLSLIFLITHAQRGSVIGGLSKSANNDRDEAVKLSRQAKKLWKDEQYFEAEKLYFKANELFPTVSFMKELADLQFDLGNVKGANKAWDECIHRLSSTTLYSKKEISDMLYQAYYYKIDDNIKRGSGAVALKTTVSAIENLKDDHKNMFSFWKSPSFSNHILFVAELAFYLEEKESLTKMQALLQHNFEKADGPQFYVDVYLKMLEGKYDEAIARALEVEDKGGDFFSSKSVSRFMLPMMYAYKGDFEKSEEWMKKSKRNILIGDKAFFAVDGRNALTQKKYKEAVEFFSAAIKPRNIMFSSIEQPGKFANYTKRAEAYEGMGDFVNAKKDFESALVYEAEYEPALTGLARLEGRVISERRKDKTPPEILITEPSQLSRGLNVTIAGNDVMIKGIAKDSFGIKSVTINGNAVYAKEDGNFWGNALLSAGNNKVTITATDLAGNTSSKTIEVEQKVNPVTTTEEIVAVAEKEGKNYALFIASQNYDDPSIPSLENPITDAVKLKVILKKDYGFKEDNIISLYNPEKNNFKQQFQQLTEVLQPEDNLIIFYAGHGVWVEKEKKGYWLLTDAKRNDTETWMPNKDVLDMISKLPTRHTLLITDACFSGSVFKTRSIGKDAPVAMQSISQKISRVAITSGNDTEVPDESVFMKYLVKALSENKDKYLTAQKMFINHIFEAVISETKTEPRYGTLELAGHVGGDFIFNKK